jgi:DnaJ-class molecular chaperone
MATDCPFATLGLEPGADPISIRRAFRTAAQHTHPDRGGDSASFQRVMAAMSTLRQRGLVDYELTAGSSSRDTSSGTELAGTELAGFDRTSLSSPDDERTAAVGGAPHEPLRPTTIRRPSGRRVMNPYQVMMAGLDDVAGLDPLPVVAPRRQTRNGQRFASILDQQLRAS